MKKAKTILNIFVICLALTGCNKFDKVLKSNDYDLKYQEAMRYYNDNSYSKAIQLFENLTMHYRGRENAEDISWYYAQSLYKEKDYYTAGYQFNRFARQFPYSNRVEEAAFLAAYCKYMESPVYSLDQSLTKEAVAEFESFAEHWPRSTYMPEVNRYLDEMRTKLMKKDYEIAYGYYFIEEYHAAYESLKNFLGLYPEAPMREDAMYYMLVSSYKFAIGSREDKKKERLQQVVADFDRVVSGISDSKKLAEAQNIYNKTRAELAKMEK